MIRQISKTSTESADGQSLRFRIQIMTGGASVDKVKEWVEEKYPATHCQHSHDCCGNWYDSKARIKFFDGDIAHVEQIASLNI